MLNGEKARIVNTDPPYNLPADYIGNVDHKTHDNFAMGHGEMSDEEFNGTGKRTNFNVPEGAIENKNRGSESLRTTYSRIKRKKSGRVGIVAVTKRHLRTAKAYFGN